MGDEDDILAVVVDPDHPVTILPVLLLQQSFINSKRANTWGNVAAITIVSD